ncbi:cytochrome P450 [Massilia niabensis]|uniref:Cytochrome P450 n=1 Tax=Massilia niabensis TaxID=544910 RepID=A0ABW0LCM5_9BURK
MSIKNTGNAGDKIDLATATIADPELSKCPFAYYAKLRQEEPVRQDPSTGHHWIVKNDDVMKAFLDSEHFSSHHQLQFRDKFQPKAQKLFEAAGLQVPPTILTSDPPEHAELRSFGMTLFPVKRVAELAPGIETIVNELIDDFIDQGHVEFSKKFAALLPATIVADEYGFPRADRDQFKTWADANLVLQTPGITEDEEVELIGQLIELIRYIEKYLVNPPDRSQGRVMYDLATRNRSDGTPFTLMERIYTGLTIFIGGVDTTAGALTAMLNHLCHHPEMQDQLRGNTELISHFVEEILRLEAPVQATPRRITKDIEFAGRQLNEGEFAMICNGSANRDEAVWGADADEFKLVRSNHNQHRTFGYGRHVCVGMHLARVELNIAIRVILDRIEDIRFQNPDNPPQRVPMAIFNAYDSMPITFKARTVHTA